MSPLRWTCKSTRTLAKELARRGTGRTLYLLDEPTTGLHIADVERLLLIMQRLVDAGNTVLVIEHNLELIKSADLDESGRVIRAEIPWSRKGQSKMPTLENTILGILMIEGPRLKIEVNSARRAKTIRAEVEKRLGRHARYITTEIQSPDAMLKAVRNQEGGMADLDPEHNKLMQIQDLSALYYFIVRTGDLLSIQGKFATQLPFICAALSETGPQLPFSAAKRWPRDG